MAIDYIILPFIVAKRGGKLIPCPPQRAKDTTKAIAAAERMAGSTLASSSLRRRPIPSRTSMPSRA